MTTIAYRNNMLVADTASWDANGVYFGKSSKLFKLNDGRLLGTAGSYSMAVRVVAWLNGEGERPVCREDRRTDRFQGLVITQDARVFHIDESLEEAEIMDCPFVAIGSGRELALGAMAMGGTAVQAVAIACEFDNCSRAPLNIERVGRG